MIPEEPTPNTSIGYTCPPALSSPTAEWSFKIEQVLYAEFERFEYLPLICQSPRTRKEYNEWWSWYRRHK